MNSLPAGTYMISDPCYVLSDKDYDRLLEETDYFGQDLPDSGGVFTDSATGLKFAVYSTAYGDGEYKDNKGRVYGVDAGCIACIPMDMVDPALREQGIDEIFAEEEFRNDFETGYDCGTIYFGRISIETEGALYGPEDEDEESDDRW